MDTMTFKVDNTMTIKIYQSEQSPRNDDRQIMNVRRDNKTTEIYNEVATIETTSCVFQGYGRYIFTTSITVPDNCACCVSMHKV